MSTFERWACVNPVWRAFTARAVIPWVFAKDQLAGEVLELGTGAGANAAALLDRYPLIRLTATDVDPAMLDVARVRLARFGDRARVTSADACALEFNDASFDVVVSMIMLHHVEDRLAALGEAARVLRAGGRLVGYDLTRRDPAARWRRGASIDHRLATRCELTADLAETGFVDVRVNPSIAGVVARFSGSVLSI